MSVGGSIRSSPAFTALTAPGTAPAFMTGRHNKAAIVSVHHREGRTISGVVIFISFLDFARFNFHVARAVIYLTHVRVPRRRPTKTARTGVIRSPGSAPDRSAHRNLSV